MISIACGILLALVVICLIPFIVHIFAACVAMGFLVTPAIFGYFVTGDYKGAIIGVAFSVTIVIASIIHIYRRDN